MKGLSLAVAMRSSHHTVRDCRTTPQQWQKLMGRDPPVDSLTADGVRNFLYHLKVVRGLAPKTVKNAHTGLSSSYTWAASKHA